MESEEDYSESEEGEPFADSESNEFENEDAAKVDDKIEGGGQEKQVAAGLELQGNKFEMFADGLNETASVNGKNQTLVENNDDGGDYGDFTKKGTIVRTTTNKRGISDSTESFSRAAAES